MATIENALIYLMNAISGLTALNGGRTWDTKMPDNPVFPATTLQAIGRLPQHTMSDRDSLGIKTYQIQHWGDDKEVVIGMAEAVRQQLDGFSGTVQVSGAGVPIGILVGITAAEGVYDIVINGILLQNELDLYDDDTRVFHRLQQFKVMFQEN